MPTPGDYTVQVACDKYPVAGPYDVEAVPPTQQVPPKGTQLAKVGVPDLIPGQPLVPVVATHNAALLNSGALKEPVPLYTGTVAPMQIASPQMKTPVKRSAETGPLQIPIEPKVARPDASASDDIVPTKAGAPHQAQMNQFGNEPMGSANGQPTGRLDGPSGQNPSGARAKPTGPGGVPHEAGQFVDAPGSMQGKYQPNPLLAGPGEYRNPRPPVLPEEKVHSMSGCV